VDSSSLLKKGAMAVQSRPRTKFVLQLKARRCPKCGGKINSQAIRCKRCHEPQKRPKK
jgi:ribosomal protein L40E